MRHFKSDLINNMDHMRISGLNIRQLFLATQRSLKIENDGPKVPKQAKKDKK